VSGGRGHCSRLWALTDFGAIALTPSAFDVVYEDANGFDRRNPSPGNAGVRSATARTTMDGNPASNYAGGAAVLVLKANGSYC